MTTLAIEDTDGVYPINVEEHHVERLFVGYWTLDGVVVAKLDDETEGLQ